jgi:hypothetical protein
VGLYILQSGAEPVCGMFRDREAAACHLAMQAGNVNLTTRLGGRTRIFETFPRRLTALAADINVSETGPIGA